MKAKTSCIIILLAFLFLWSCKNDAQLDSDAEIRYKYFKLENTGWKSRVSEQVIDDIIFTAVEVPLPYYILKDLGNDNLITVDSISNVNKQERIIEFEYTQNEEEDLLTSEFTGMSYEESVKYMSFKLQKDFYVVTSKNDTIKCSGATYERKFKVSPSNKILLFFTGIEPGDDIQLVYDDRLYKKGTIKFRFNDKITKLLL